jgi:hypothetical protein
MRKISYLMWFLLFIIYVLYIILVPVPTAVRAPGNMASIGAGIGNSLVFVLTVLMVIFPIASLAYLFNWRAAFRKDSPLSVGHQSEAVIFFLIAALTGFASAFAALGANSIFYWIFCFGCLPIFIFGITNLINYFRIDKLDHSKRKKIELALFAGVAVLLGVLVSASFQMSGARFADIPSEFSEFIREFTRRSL